MTLKELAQKYSTTPRLLMAIFNEQDTFGYYGDLKGDEYIIESWHDDCLRLMPSFSLCDETHRFLKALGLEPSFRMEGRLYIVCYLTPDMGKKAYKKLAMAVADAFTVTFNKAYQL